MPTNPDSDASRGKRKLDVSALRVESFEASEGRGPGPGTVRGNDATPACSREESCGESCDFHRLHGNLPVRRHFAAPLVRRVLMERRLLNDRSRGRSIAAHPSHHPRDVR
jgi:hypothetical protein